MMTNRLQTQGARGNRIPATSKGGHRIAVFGGKGGVGKTNIATNLAVAAAALDSRVLLVDGDLGLANVDVLLGLTPRGTAADLLCGRSDLDDVLVEGPGGIHVVPAASARMDLASSRPAELTRLLAPILEAGHRYDLVIVDIGSGVSAPVLSLASVCDRALLVTTPELTSIADAYGTMKVVRQVAPELPLELLVNVAQDELQALAAHRHLERIGARFLGFEIPLRGFLMRDPRLVEAVSAQRAVVEAFPSAPVSQQLVKLAAGLVGEIGKVPPTTRRTDRWRKVTS